MTRIKVLWEEQGHQLLALPPYSLTTSPLGKHGLISKSTSEKYRSSALLFGGAVVLVLFEIVI